jgi:cytochrome c biogenesis protein CcmG/thiol:disulfide interchange protein DsbE
VTGVQGPVDGVDAEFDPVDPVAADRPGSGPEGPPRSHLARNAALAVGAVLLLLIVVLATGKPPEDAKNPLVGHRVPALSGPTIHGDTVDIDSFRGRWVVVNFLASWCTGCLAEHPDLVRFAEQHRDDAQILGVGFNDSRENMQTFFQEHGGDWPVVLSDSNRVAVDFGVTGVPESFVVAPDGRIVAWSQGITLDWLNQVIADNGGTAAVAPPAPAAGAAGSPQ